MRQKDVIMKQLAQKVTDSIEPVIPYLVIGSKKAAEEAGKKVGPDVWEIKKKLWEKLCSRECSELKEAAGDMVVAPSDPEVKQVFIQEILRSFEKYPDLTREISPFMEDEAIQRMMAGDSSVKLIKQSSKQNSIDKNKVLEEFNKFLEEFIAKNSTVQDLERFKTPDTETTALDLRITTENDASAGKPHQHYKHIQLDQRIITEDSSAIAIRMAKIAEITQIDVEIQNESQRAKALLALVSQLEGSEKEEIMEKALNFASRIQYGDIRSDVLSLLVPILEEPRKVEFIEKALYSASNIQDEDERAIVLSSLASHLRGKGKEEIMENIFDFASHLKYGDAKFQILSSLVPHLYGSRNEELIEKALELAFGIQSEYRRVESLSFLVPHLNGQRKEEILEESLKLASNLKDKDMRPEALSFILPYMDESRQKEILEKAFNLACGIQSEYRRAQALSSLAPYLDEPGK